MRPSSILNLILLYASTLITSSALLNSTIPTRQSYLSIIGIERQILSFPNNVNHPHSTLWEPQWEPHSKLWSQAMLPIEEISVNIREVLETAEKKLHELRNGISYHTNANSSVGQGILSTHALADCQWKVPHSDSCGVQGLVHLQDVGDVRFQSSEFAGTRGESRRLEGFLLELANPIPNVNLQYMAYLQGVGDTVWVEGGQFIGTRGESRRLEGFAIRLVGAAADNYNVYYTCHLQDMGDTPVLSNGEFCGTRGEGLRLEGFHVWIQRQ